MSINRRIKPESWIFIGMILLVILLVVIPLFWILIGAILEKGELNFKYLIKSYHDPYISGIITNTLIISLSSALIATLMGMVLAWITTRTDTPLREKFGIIVIIPFIINPFMSAMAWDILGNKEVGVINLLSRSFGFGTIINIESMIGMIWVLALYTAPLVFLIVSSVLKLQDSALEESATICGSKRFYTFFHVTLPSIKPGLLAGFFLAFVVSSGLFGVHSVIGRPANILLLTTEIRRTMSILPMNFNMGAVLSLILLAIVFIGLYIQIKSLGERRYANITKSFKSKIIQLGRWKYVTLAICFIYLALAVFLPFLVFLVRSFKPYAFGAGSAFKDVFSGWSFKSYVRVFEYDTSIRALTNSILLSISAAIIVILIGVVASYIITKTNLRGRRVLNFLCMAPIAIPGIALGVGLLRAYSTPPLMLYGTIIILLMAYVIGGLPYALQSLVPSFLQVHKELEESARICGSSWWKQFHSIMLPLIKPAILATFMFVFLISFRDVGASILLSGYGKEVIGVFLFNRWEEGFIAEVSATAIITSIIVTFILIIAQKMIKKRELAVL